MSSKPHFRCPQCGRDQLRDEHNSYYEFHRLWVGEHALGSSGLLVDAVRCLNKDCNKLSLKVFHTGHKLVGSNTRADLAKVHNKWGLLPESDCVPQPECVPNEIAQTYYEACRIVDLSPKASATLARRCLQGMIQDFANIRKRTLALEIQALVDALAAGNAPKGVSDESIEALQAIRGVGNIGAHMEKEVDVIVDVDPGEARALIRVIEQLFDDWYVQREKRAKRFSEAAAVGEIKKRERGGVTGEE